MFHECKVYDGGGKLKVTYTSDQMSQHHWDGMGDSASQFIIEGAEISPSYKKLHKRSLTCANVSCKKKFTTMNRKAKACSDRCGTAIKREKEVRRRRAKGVSAGFTEPQEYENGFYGYKFHKFD